MLNAARILLLIYVSFLVVAQSDIKFFTQVAGVSHVECK